MNGTTVAVLCAFAAYLGLMIVIGVIYMKRTSSTEDYFLGGRNLSGLVAAFSAQASDMSSWLLMGLPGAVYSLGMGQVWIAVGLLLGTIANWLFVSGKLRRYTIRLDALTLPEFYEKRYHDKKRVLLLISSIVIAVFFLVYTASALTAGGKLFTSVFGLDYHVALAIGAAVILIYTLMGGFMAVCVTDLIQGMMMLVCLMVVPILAWALVSENGGFMANLTAFAPAGGPQAFLDPFLSGDKPLSFVDILSQLAWGLGYCGMPHILVRFMAIKDKKELKKSKTIAIVWIIASLAFAVAVGVIGTAFLMPEKLGVTTAIGAENVFIEMIKKVFMVDYRIPFVGGIFLCGILAAIMSTADSQLLVTASAISSDLYKGVIKKDASGESVLLMSRITVVVVALLAFIIAWDPNNSIMGLVSNAWSGLGSAFGPLTLFSLYWKRTNLQGAMAGMVVGGVTVLVWDYLPIVGGATLAAATGIYSLLIGFILSSIAILVVSLATPAPPAAIVAEFEEANSDKEEA